MSITTLDQKMDQLTLEEITKVQEKVQEDFGKIAEEEEDFSKKKKKGPLGVIGVSCGSFGVFEAAEAIKGLYVDRLMLFSIT